MPDNPQDTATAPTIEQPQDTSATPQRTPRTNIVSGTANLLKQNRHSVSSPKGGRPPVQIDVDEVERCAALGMTMPQIAEGLGIGERTLHHYKATNQAVLAAYKRGNFRYQQELLKQIQANNAKGNIATQIFTAKQRHTLNWSDQQQITHAGGVTFTIQAGVASGDKEPIDITPGAGDGTETDV